MKKTAKEIIAYNLPTFLDVKRPPNIHALNDAAERIIGALRADGYVIIRDRADPEGGIPGRT